MRNKLGSKIKSNVILRRVLLSLVGLFLGVNIYLFNATSIVGNKLPMPFGYGAAVVLSGSMEPALSVNNLIIVEESKAYDKGDIVVYQDGNELIVHRIVSIDKDSVITKGDANSVSDNPIRKSSIKGKVIVSIPFIGVLINILKSPLGTITILILAFMLLERSYKNDKNKNLENLDIIRQEIEKIKESYEMEGNHEEK
ncbi:signal peptidase I [Breznakia sp. PF5-3]|uniref:signal peptidase I n=1 Tax=unclassified Breznakia TaxID=2623764 RepID=UPI002406B9D0|nr:MULTISPECIES: signal peptidase I [unclassified Breznakia]MDF9825400.1 signal peptidase I [Breznakia sp. PM6-1]MDF9836278.1 signal peptidase I [Breznakia sp. PF5-3]MDF9837570.1 signal peptidase I [Breznakia sp. PFB2-8]MDF9860183.1 signal peptidase I [Breznakia sp. PH5-24]